MFGSLGFNEILFIMVLALLIFGPKRLPQIGRTLGKALGEFRRASSDLKRSMEVELTLAEEREKATASASSSVGAAGTEPRREGDETRAFERVEESAAAGDEPDRGAPELGKAGEIEDDGASDDAADDDAESAESADAALERASRPTEGS